MEDELFDDIDLEHLWHDVQNNPTNNQFDTSLFDTDLWSNDCFLESHPNLAPCTNSDSDSGVSGSCSNGQESGQASVVKLLSHCSIAVPTNISNVGSAIGINNTPTMSNVTSEGPQAHTPQTPRLLASPLKTLTASNGLKTIVISNNVNNANNVLLNSNSRSIVKLSSNGNATLLSPSLRLPSTRPSLIHSYDYSNIHQTTNLTSPSSVLPSTTPPVKIQPKYNSLNDTPTTFGQSADRLVVTSSPQQPAPLPLITQVVYSSANSKVMDPFNSDLNQVERLLKRQEKMIKNRQAASLSRQRKKEYLDRLEKALEDLREENNILRHQNLEWQTRYLELESNYKEKYSRTIKQEVDDNSLDTTDSKRSLQGKVSSKTNKSYRFSPISNKNSGSVGGSGGNSAPIRTAVAASSVFFSILCLFLVSGWLPLHSIPSANSGLPQLHHSRALLSVVEQPHSSDNDTRLAKCLRQLSDHQATQNTSHSWHNSSRLNRELTDILTRHNTYSRRALFLHRRRQYRPKAAVFAPSAASPSDHVHRPSNTQLKLYNGIWERRLDHLVPLSDRVNDSVYVVSLAHTHIIAPALVNNSQTHRPKITFLIPTHPPPYGDETVSLMQIHCEVINFTTTQVDAWRVAQLRNYDNWHAQQP